MKTKKKILAVAIGLFALSSCGGGNVSSQGKSQNTQDISQSSVTIEREIKIRGMTFLVNVDGYEGRVSLEHIDADVTRLEFPEVEEFDLGENASSFHMVYRDVAFDEATNVEEIIFPSYEVYFSTRSMPKLRRLDYSRAPKKVRGIGGYPSVKEIVFPEGITSIEGFEELGIETLEIPASVKTIEDRSFYDCESLKELRFADNTQLQSFTTSAFGGCSVERCYLGDGMKRVEFSGLFYATRIFVPQSVEVLKVHASVIFTDGPATFMYSEETHVYAGSSPSAIIPFADREKMESENHLFFAKIAEGEAALVLALNDGNTIIDIPSETVVGEETLAVTTIAQYAFQNFSTSEDYIVNLPSSVTTIESHAFYNPEYKPKAVFIPKSVINFPDDDSMFGTLLCFEGDAYSDYGFSNTGAISTISGVSSLRAIDGDYLIGSSVGHEGKNLILYSFVKQEEVVFPSSFNQDGEEIPLDGVGSEIFDITQFETTIKKISFENFANKNIVIGDNAFSRLTSLEEVDFSSAKISYLGKMAFYYTTSLSSANLSSSALKEIQSGCFSFSGITSLSLPSTLEVIGENAFDSCRSLSSMNLRNCTSLKTISQGAFSDCKSLDNVVLPRSSLRIYKDAFANVVTSFYVPSTVIYVELGAFAVGASIYTDSPSQPSNWHFYSTTSVNFNAEAPAIVYYDPIYKMSFEIHDREAWLIKSIGAEYFGYVPPTIDYEGEDIPVTRLCSGCFDGGDTISVSIRISSNVKYVEAGIAPNFGRIEGFICEGDFDSLTIEAEAIDTNTIGKLILPRSASLEKGAFKANRIDEVHATAFQLAKGGITGGRIVCPDVGIVVFIDSEAISTMYLFESLSGYSTLSSVGFDSCYYPAAAYFGKETFNNSYSADYLRFSETYTRVIPSTLTKVSLLSGSGFMDKGFLKGFTSLSTVDFGTDFAYEKLSESFLEGCTGISTLEIPSCVKTISSFAFKGMTSLNAITLPEGLESLGARAFEGCTSLNSVELADDGNYFLQDPEDESSLQPASWTSGEDLASKLTSIWNGYVLIHQQ